LSSSAVAARENGAARSADLGGLDVLTQGPRLSRVVLMTVLLGFAVVAVLTAREQGIGGDRLVVFLVLLAALLSLHVGWFVPRGRRLRTGPDVAAFAALGLLSFVPLAVFGLAWSGVAGFFGGVALLVLPARWRVLVAVLVPLATAAWYVGAGFAPDQTVYALISTVNVEAVVFGLSRLTQVVDAVVTARRRLTDAAVTEERLRIARDLHDLLGYSLSAITLKVELVSRLVAFDVPRSQAELGEVLAISREALSDVRAVTSRYRDLDLRRELDSARRVLEAGGVVVDVAHDEVDLPAPTTTTLATVVREGVTNVLRHSDARTCSLRLDVARRAGTVTLTILNDGAHPEGAEEDGHGGAGLRNLADRVRELGGALEAGRGTVEGSFRLSVVVPAA
jgi:signal transduction histidine kinase